MMAPRIADEWGEDKLRNRVARKLLRAGGGIIAVYLVIALSARFTGLIDRYFIFFPDRDVTQDPGDRGLEFEDVYFEAPDGVRLHGWFVPGRTGATMLWLHGNGGNIGHRVGNIVELHNRLGISVFIFDYRGYGRSEGSPTEEGTYMDAEAALGYLGSRGDVDRRKVVLFGRSLGCAVAAEMATRHDVRAVVLESPFTSIRAMAKRAYPFLPGIGSLVSSRYDTLAKVRDVHVPLMVMHGDRDDTVPFDMGEEVFEAANVPKRFYRIEGAGHNDTYVAGGGGYYRALAEFLGTLGTGDG